MAGALEGSETWSWIRFTPGELSDNPFTALFNCWKPALESQGLSVRDTAVTLQQNPEDLTGLMGLVSPELSIDNKNGGLSSEVGRNKPAPAGVSGDITGQRSLSDLIPAYITPLPLAGEGMGERVYGLIQPH